MFTTLTNLLNVLRRYKLASALNLLGISVAFTAFMLIVMHARYEYSYDNFHPYKDRIFQLENQRTDGIWESNFSRPHLERIFASSPHIVAGATYRGGGYSSQARVSVSTSDNSDEMGVIATVDFITPGFTEVFHFDMVEGSLSEFGEPGKALIPLSIARKIYGDEPAVGNILYTNEFEGLGEAVELSAGIKVITKGTVIGVYRDFPENTRLYNAIFFPIQPDEMMHDIYTGCYYAYVLLDSPDASDEVIDNYMEHSGEIIRDALAVTGVRMRPLDGLYFQERVRYDAAPHGNKPVTDTLLFVSLLIILIASINFVNFSVALTPVRIKGINTRKILGCRAGSLRRDLVTESVLITALAFILALVFTWMIQESGFFRSLLGPSIGIGANWDIVIASGVLALAVGLLAGLYPAWYMTSFPPAFVVNGSFLLTGRAKFVRKALIGFQYVISIVLIISAIFIHIQNRYIARVDMGFDKENILEVKLSAGTAILKSNLYREKLMEDPGIIDVAFSEHKFVQDEAKPSIGYFFNGEHHFQYWMQASWNFPEVMDLKLLEGRYFNSGDENTYDNKAVCMISKASAEDMGAAPGDMFRENGQNVEIVGIFDDARFESLYEPVKPLGIWVSSDKYYHRRTLMNYSYVRIAPGDPAGAIAHIRSVMKELAPTYPVEIRFFDERIDELYNRSHNQGRLITLFCIIAVLLSIVGVFGLVVFESQGRVKEVAIRKVMGGTTGEILVLFNKNFMWVVAVCCVIAAPLAWFAVRAWLGTFAVKTPIHLWVFIVAFLVIILLTFITVTVQSYRAANENPVKALNKG